MENLPGLPTDMAFALLGICVLSVLHGSFTSSDVRLVFDYFKRMLAARDMPSQRQIDQQVRLEEQLLRRRIQMLHMVNKFCIHLAFLFSCSTFWRTMQHPTMALRFQCIVSVLGYCLHAFSEGKVTTNLHFRCLEVIVCGIHFMFAMGVACEEDLVKFCCEEKMCVLTLFFMSVFLIDVKVVVVLYVFEAVVFTYRFWCLIGFSNLTPHLIFATLTSHCVWVFALVLLGHNVLSNIAAKQSSGDASSLMLGFRNVLRGVCDGDVLLDRKSCLILDDASCLERLLKSNKRLCETNFLDLFLDAESREKFLNFLNFSAPDGPGPIPAGLRVSLQGANGPVSLDLFHTRIPGQDSLANDYCLLAMKEDPEVFQQAPPDAPSGTVPVLPRLAGRVASAARTRSSETEVVESLEELVEIALLFNNATGLLDIREVRLCFERQSSAPNIESGMPTLRRFIRPSDWDRIEKMLRNVMSLPPAEIERRCYFRNPMLFRVPGSSRSYFSSNDTYITLADPKMDRGGHPIYFRMHLAAFDGRHILRPREQELAGIEEE